MQQLLDEMAINEVMVEVDMRQVLDNQDLLNMIGQLHKQDELDKRVLLDVPSAMAQFLMTNQVIWYSYLYAQFNVIFNKPLHKA